MNACNSFGFANSFYEIEWEREYRWFYQFKHCLCIWLQCATSRVRSMRNASKSSTIPSTTATAATSASATTIVNHLFNSTIASILWIESSMLIAQPFNLLIELCSLLMHYQFSFYRICHNTTSQYTCRQAPVKVWINHHHNNNNKWTMHQFQIKMDLFMCHRTLLLSLVWWWLAMQLQTMLANKVRI